MIKIERSTIWAGMVFIWLVILFVAGLNMKPSNKETGAAWGGTVAFKLKDGEKLVGVSWRESRLWVLVRPARVGEVAEEYEFREEVADGASSGSIRVVEVLKAQ